MRCRMRGYTFYFKGDPQDPALLHIFARHLKKPQDAIRLFFSGETVWNSDRERFETMTDKECLFWFWISQVEKRVMAVSCFDLKEEK